MHEIDKGVFRTLSNIYANPASIYLFKNRNIKTPQKSKKKGFTVALVFPFLTLIK